MRLALAAALALAVTVTASAQEVACVAGTAAVPDVGSFPCENVDLVGYLPVSAFSTPGSPAPNGNNDIWGWTDPQTGTEYAVVATYNGTGFVDLSDPTRPLLVGKLPTQTTATSWRDVKVHDDHAFIVSEASGHGMQVFDLTRLRAVQSPPVTFGADVVYTGIGSAHNIVINEETGFAYAVGAPRIRSSQPASCSARGFHTINIQDPMNPTFAGCFTDVDQDVGFGGRAPGYTHDAQCVVYRGPDQEHRGKELCFGSNENNVVVFDVSDKDNVTILSTAFYPTPAYSHQGSLTTDQRYFLADDELDELNGFVSTQRTLILDFEDLDNPSFAFTYDSGIATIDHNQYVVGRYVFQSNYTAGLRILDLTEIGNGTLTEVAYFDTFPANDRIAFDGQWSNYPYFESGLVIANDSNNGLFVLRPAASLGVASEAPPATGVHLSDPVPNPTARQTRLTLRVDDSQTARAVLYDVAGRQLAVVYDGLAPAGADVELAVQVEGLPAGVYVLRVVGERFETSRRLVVTR